MKKLLFSFIVIGFILSSTVPVFADTVYESSMQGGDLEFIYFWNRDHVERQCSKMGYSKLEILKELNTFDKEKKLWTVYIKARFYN